MAVHRLPPLDAPEGSTGADDRRSILRELKRGSIELIVLHLLASGEAYGYEIASKLAAETNGALAVSDGTLYPVLYRLERAGWVVDVAVLAVALLPVALVAAWVSGRVVVGLGADAACTWLFFAIYTAFAEWRYSRTVGKAYRGLRVVDESGARISGGQALVRQLPVVLQVFWIDIFFALFTERHQRAFELLSKTRVVAAGRE